MKKKLLIILLLAAVLLGGALAFRALKPAKTAPLITDASGRPVDVRALVQKIGASR